ncbi:MAG: hypothetical protein ACHQAY_22220 [Hyphomicrobiales bacterium]
MRHLTDDIVLSVKDAVRNLRYAIRSEARRPRMSGLSDARMNPAHDRARSRDGLGRGRVARLVDSVFTEVESGALALVAPVRDIGHDIAFPQPVTAYFGHGPSQDEAAERLFARAHYHAVKALLHGFGLNNVLIFEHVIGRARDAVLARHADLVRSIRGAFAEPGSDEGRAERVRLCAALTCGLVETRPIKEIDFSFPDLSRPRGLVTAPNTYCFAVTGLATAIASVQDEAELPASAEIIESAQAVVDVRFGRFSAALEADEPTEALAFEFDEILPFLP